ncbi:MAG: tetratricopeptide repeat protein [Opitutales bacterium]
MKRIHSILLAAALLAAPAATLPAQQGPSKPSVERLAPEFWNDEAFVKDFLGSYGFLAGYEPTISEEEKEALRSLIDLIKVSPSAAIRELEPQIKSSSSAAFDFILANLYFQEGELDEAEEFYLKAVKKHPDFRRAYKNLGLVQVQKGDFDEAIPTISKAMELGEVDGRAYGLLGYGYLTQERYFPAEAAYRQAILMQPEVKDWKVGLARTLLESSRYTEAASLFQTLLQDEPDNADFWLLQSNAYLGQDQPLQAAKNIEVARRMGAADLQTLTLLGDIYMNDESPDLALDAYLEAAEEAGPDDTKSLIRAAELLTRSVNYPQAKTMIAAVRDKQTELGEQDEMQLLTLEAKIARAEGDDETAVATLNRIVEQDSLNGEALIELANYYADQGDMAKATNRFEQAQKIEKFERQALVAHAQALVRDGQYEDAVPLLRRALQIKPDQNLEDYLSRVERAARNQS